MKKIVCVGIALCLCALLAAPVFAAATGQPQEEPGQIVESGQANADIMPRTQVWVGGDESKGGLWDYGSNPITVWSNLQTTYWNNRTSVQPGPTASIHTSGFVGVGQRAAVSTWAALFGNNSAYYDLKEP